MKSLLQNKRVRINLYKWLGMYIGVIALFTSVVTYSKYITEISRSDDARVANFNINVNYDKVKNCTAGTTESTCLVGKYRPTSDIPYYFTVDTKELEVRTFFVLSIYVDSNFEIVGLSKLKEGTIDEYIDLDLTSKKKANKITLKEIIKACQGSETKYKLTIRYNGLKIVRDENNNPLYYDESKVNNEELPAKIVTVNYSAEQITASDMREVTD